jgi:hypothetical protein
MSTTTIASKEEKTLLELFESSLESTEITSTTISVCQALCSSYMYEERYKEACAIYSRVVKKVWASIETTTVVDVTEITESFTEEIFELAVSLAVCHFKMLRVDVTVSCYTLFDRTCANPTIGNHLHEPLPRPDLYTSHREQALSSRQDQGRS